MVLHRIKRIGYITNTFPAVTTTFEVHEICGLERLGIEIELFSIRRPYDTIVHKKARELVKRVTYATPISFRDVIMTNLYFLMLYPSQYLKVCLSHLIHYALPYHYHEITLFIKTIYLAKIIKDKELSHIHASFCSEATTSALIISRLLGITYSFKARAIDLYVYSTGKQIIRKVMNARFVATESEYNKKYLLELCGKRFQEKIHVIYGGHDFEQDRQPYKKRPDSQIEILSVGRFMEKKGFVYLIKSCGLLKRKGYKFRCRIVGDGPDKSELERLIKDYGLEDMVYLMPYAESEELKKIYSETDIFVLPCVIAGNGDRDAIPTVLVDVMAIGIPVISTNISGIPELVEDEKDGILVSERSVIELAAAIEKLIIHEELRISLGKRGMEKVRSRFDVNKNVAAYAELLNQTCP